MDPIAPITSGSQAYAVAHELGLVPSLVFLACYLHALAFVCPFIVEGLGYLKALVGAQKLTPEQLAAAKAEAQAEVVVPSGAGLLARLAGALRRTAAIILITVVVVGCASAPAKSVDMPTIHASAAKIAHGLELELAATAPVSTAHAKQREALRSDVAALVSATQ